MLENKLIEEIRDLVQFAKPADLENALLKCKSAFSLNEVLNNGNSLLAEACAYNNVEMVEFLIEQEVEIDKCDLDLGGEPALKICYDSNYQGLYELLLSSGANIQAKGWMGISVADRLKGE